MREAPGDSTGKDGVGTVQVGHFMERLMGLTLRDWNEAAMESPDTIAEESDRAMKAALANPTLAIDVWNVRDNIELAVCRFGRPEGRPYVSKKGSRAHIRRVTERAALAVLVRDALGAMHFVVCYGGFERVIPVSGL